MLFSEAEMWEVTEYLEEDDHDGTVLDSYSSRGVVDAEEFEVTDYSESSFLENECALALLELAHSFVFSSYDNFDMGLRSKPKPAAAASAQTVAPHSVPVSAVNSTVLNLKAFNALISRTPNNCSVIELDHSYAGKNYLSVRDSTGDAVKKSATVSSNETKARSRRRFVESPVAALSNVAPGMESGSPPPGEMAGESAPTPEGKGTTEESVSPRRHARPRHPSSSFGSRRAYLESSVLDLSRRTVGRNGRRIRRNRKAQPRPKPAKASEARAIRDYCPPKYVRCKR